MSTRRVSFSRVYNDKHVEAALVLGSSYLLFWFCELIVGTSAVLAVVVMGLYLNYHKEAFSPECHHFLHELYAIKSESISSRRAASFDSAP